MTTKLLLTVIICACALPSISFGESPRPVLPDAPILVAALDATKEDGHGPQGNSITYLKTQLAGTNWRADPPTMVRPGLYPTLKFNQKNVEPANYRYEIDSHDFTVRIFFNHGDTQLMLLTDNGKHLSFTFHGKDYSYALTSR